MFLPDSGQVSPGTYMTSNYEVFAGSWPGVAEDDNRLLSAFDGTDPRGT